ncbi:MAG: RecQ family ATP-dependent DNA helicase [Bacteroidales bacterium]|nr:RecQ family ATP-dependent DNA helicase [Bacteroidales bacterium]
MTRFQEILKKYWGYDTFRPVQLDIIRSVFEGHDTLGLLPTGGGKSITFQVPALAKEGLCIVVTPLVALMLDQVGNLKRHNIPADAIYSGLSQREIELIFNKASAKQIKFLYISPERIKTPLFQHQIQGIDVGLIAVDESHCISQWGYDFRPAYLEIADLRELVPEAPIIALTASATPDVIDDIQKQLQFKNGQVFRKSFFRDNLIYISRFVEDKMHYLLQILNKIDGTAIIYVRNRKRTYEIAKFLYDHKISADYYHAGLDHSIRKQKQEYWQNNQIRVMVSTNAFGMGIDKPDVRLVLHLDLPDSLEAYYQEAGRGGRDGYTAYAGVIYNQEDLQKLKESIEQKYPPISEIMRTYAAIGSFLRIPVGAGENEEFEFDFSRFIVQYKLNVATAFNAIKLLEKEGWIELSEPIDAPSKIHILIDNNDLYRFYIGNPDFEGFIKILLRTYQGLFSSFININEHHISKKANISVQTVIKYLQILEQNGILKYQGRKSSTYIRFLQARMEERYIHISPEFYQYRKAHDLKKIQSIIQFVSSKEQCRSQIILEYFGEKDAGICGMCDVCKEQIDSFEHLRILAQKVINMLNDRPHSESELLQLLKTNQTILLKAISPLIDEKKIVLNDEKMFEKCN